ncbi:putative chitinase [Helianthus annuus]|uniref:chitinase n=3 Tax=Helianthus annuus TaxID=4232 RepID=A0A251UI89_HELAN|nr:putative chitinase [Helianthus annuus]KAJ0479048.1 putative chitinase [Helianthus annuus]KAJ0665887.1 putative chitinase [Helianthus annuus]KAJ0851668.1 putative chitinase [Helianthus annuus]
MNLAGHCDPGTPHDCDKVSTGIHHCQSLGVKVLLSIGGATDTYSLSSADDARGVANYIWNNFLGGHSNSRPLGDAVLDGVDFDIEQGEPHYAALANRLRELGGDKIYLSAAPQCPFPDAKLQRALNTNQFNYIWVQFYNNPQCEFNANNVASFMKSWRQWTSSFPGSKIFIGVPASKSGDAASSGYIPKPQMTSKVIPFAKMSQNYGGVMLWNRYFDGLSYYSDAIKSSV